MRWRLVLSAAVVVVVAVGTVAVFGGRDASPTGIDVRVNGRPIVARRGATVAEVLRHAHAQPHYGALYAAGGGVLDAHWAVATVWRNARPARLDDRVHDGDRVGFLNGTDTVEPTALVPVSLPAPGGLPDVETQLWQPGHDGTAANVVGIRSGEILRQYELRAPLPAAPLTALVVALTFDDGPDPRYTPRVLDILRRARAQATFCVVGYAVRAHPDLVIAEHNEGHTICDHTDAHPRLDRMALIDVDAQIAAPIPILQQLTGERPAFFRAPYGVITPRVTDVAHREDLRILGWSVDPADYTRPTPTVIANRVLTAIHPGAIVLMHDGGGDRSNTVAALPAIVAGIQARGYSIVAVAHTTP